VPTLSEDRPLHIDMATCAAMIDDGTLRRATSEAVGGLV